MMPLVGELKRLIVETLLLDDVKPDDIDPDAPLFVKGLGLDSIDALELSKAIAQTYGVQILADDQRNRRTFASVRNLAEFITENRTRQDSP